MRPDAPLQLGPVRLRNRVVKAATFEGMTPSGQVTDALIGFHRRIARGGVAMVTMAYGAVTPEGRTMPDQVVVDRAALPGLRRLVEAVHAEGAAASIQLTHCGGFSRLRGSVGPSSGLNLYGIGSGAPWVRGMTEAELLRLAASFGDAARLAAEAGFDTIELHAGHGYLLHQHLSPAKNRRRDGWGGSLAGRLRFPLAALDAARRAFPGAVVVKMNLEDHHPGGLGIDDAVEIARAFVAGGADALVLSCGVVDTTPFSLLRGRVPLPEMLETEHNPLQRLGLRWFSGSRLRAVPWTPMFLLEPARVVRAATQAPLMLLGGVVDAAHLQTAMDEGFELVQVGRALIHDPDWWLRCATDAGWRSTCTHCNRCVGLMERGVRCTEGGGARPFERA